MNTLLTFAQTLKAGELNIVPIEADQVLFNSLNLAYFVAGIIAVIVIIIAGFTFTTAGSDPGAVTKAKNAIIYAVIGIVVIMTAFVITQFVVRRF